MFSHKPSLLSKADIENRPYCRTLFPQKHCMTKARMRRCMRALIHWEAPQPASSMFSGSVEVSVNTEISGLLNRRKGISFTSLLLDRPPVT